VVDPNCEVHDLLLAVVDFEQEVPDLRSGGTPPPPNLTPAYTQHLSSVIHLPFTSVSWKDVKYTILYCSYHKAIVDFISRLSFSVLPLVSHF